MSDANAGHGTGSDVFPVDGGLHRLEIWLRAIQLSPYSAGPATRRPGRLARPLLSWHALVPFTFRIQVSHQTQEPPSEFLPAAPGIQQGASRRSGSGRRPSTDGGASRGVVRLQPRHGMLVYVGLNREVASRLAEERLAEWRRLAYAQWRLMLDDSESRQVAGEDGKRYSVVSSAVDDGEERIRMLVAVDDGGWSALSPLCRDEIMRPDGSLLD